MGLFAKKKKTAVVVDKRNRTLRRVSLVTALIFIVSLLLFNILFDALLGDKLKWDWSYNQMFSIGDITRELLDGVDDPIQITGLYAEGSDANLYRIELALQDYVEEADGNIEVRYVDMDVTPDIGLDLDPTGMKEFEAGTFIVKNMESGRMKVVTQSELFTIDEEAYYNTGAVTITGISAESAFSGAIKYVTAEVTPMIYTLQGHGETDIAGYTALMSILSGSNNIELSGSLNLMVDPNIPDDCSMILMSDPEDDITPDEKRILQEYLEKGGDLMVLTQYSTGTFPRLNEILADYNIEITNDRVREDDVDRRFNEAAYTFYADWPAGTLNTTGVDSTSLMAVNARNIRILANAKDWVNVEPLVQTSDSGVSEAKGDSAQSSATGVQVIGAMCENTGWMSSNVEESSKVMVLGSIQMLSDSVLQYYNTNNGYLFYSSVNWLTDAQNTNLFITEKTLPSYLLQKGSQTGYIFASVGVLAIIPAALLVVGLVVFRRRKNL